MKEDNHSSDVIRLKIGYNKLANRLNSESLSDMDRRNLIEEAMDLFDRIKKIDRFSYC